MCPCVSGSVSSYIYGCASVNWCVCVCSCVDGMLGWVSLRIHIQLFPSDYGQGALSPLFDPSSTFQRTLSVGVSLLALPLGTGPPLLPRSGGVGVCKHLERAPPKSPLQEVFPTGKPGWPSPCFLRIEPLSSISRESSEAQSQEIPALLV